MKNSIDRSVYAILAGTFAGEMWVLMEESPQQKSFLSVPKMEKRVAPNDRWQNGLANKIVEFVKVLPKPHYKQFKKIWKKL